MNKPTPSLIILAAGMSSRMKKSLEALNAEEGTEYSSKDQIKPRVPSTNTHKGLIPIDSQGKTVIDLLIHEAECAGISRIILVIQPPGTALKNHFTNRINTRNDAPKAMANDKQNATIDFAFQKIPEGREKPLGTADALLQCMEQFPELHHEQFIVCNADNLYSREAFVALISSDCNNALIGYDREGLDFPLEKIRSFALLVQDDKQYMTKLIEKPDQDHTQRLTEQGQQLSVSMNLWKFKGSDLYAALLNCPVHPQRQEKELPNAVRLMITKQKTKILVITRKEHVPDLTQASDIEDVRLYLTQQDTD